MRLPHLHLQTLITGRPILFIAAGVGLGIALVLQATVPWHPMTRLLVAWDVSAALYLLLAWASMARATLGTIRRRAQTHDEGAVVILALVIVAACASLAGGLVELGLVKTADAVARAAHPALAALTLALSWCFIHTIFALHYAHDYYAAELAGRPGGLDFPGEPVPLYGDFLYFAFIIGTSGQTADVSISSRTLRRIGIAHCVVAFVFNTMVLALTINLAAGLF